MRETVRQALESFRPRGARESAHRARMRRLVGAAGDPFARDHFDPGHFTASAFVLSPLRDQLLLVHHRKLRRWLQPGGHIEPGDVSPQAAARREVLEETGLRDLRALVLDARAGAPLEDGLFDLDVHAIPAHGREPDHLHHDLRFLFVSSDDRPEAGDGVEAVRWVSLDRVGSLESDESMMRAVAKIQRHVLGLSARPPESSP